MAENDQPSIPGRRLAERLRALREHEHLTQKQMAQLLGGSEPLSIATVSLWEKPGSDRLPPPARWRPMPACSAPAGRLMATSLVCSAPVS